MFLSKIPSNRTKTVNNTHNAFISVFIFMCQKAENPQILTIFLCICFIWKTCKRQQKWTYDTCRIPVSVVHIQRYTALKTRVSAKTAPNCNSCKSVNPEVAMAHRLSLWGKGGQQRRQYFFFHFVRKPSSWKKVCLKCLLPPPGSLCLPRNTSGNPAIGHKIPPPIHFHCHSRLV